MNLGALLRAMKFVHLEGRDSGAFVRSEVKRFARRRDVGPVSGTDVVIRRGVESAGGRQEPVDCPNVRTFLLPAENERLIIGIGKAAAAAERALSV